MASFTLLYPTPLAIITALNVNREAAINYVKEKFPSIFDLFITGSCNMNLPGLKMKIWFAAAVIQISLIYGVMLILGYKINQQLMKYKLSMSHRSFKARKQLLFALIIQMIVPLIFIVIPVAGLYICIILEIPDIADLSQWVLQFFGLHSCGNALTIISMIKPYRQAINNALKRFKCFIFGQRSLTISVSATAVSYPPSLAVPVTKTTSRIKGELYNFGVL
uniref:Uncharacterized protein n=1 Tax=Panagrolaimus superbus TaxID=310955 RepID=A0A914Y9N5_9BILA